MSTEATDRRPRSREPRALRSLPRDESRRLREETYARATHHRAAQSALSADPPPELAHPEHPNASRSSATAVPAAALRGVARKWAGWAAMLKRAGSRLRAKRRPTWAAGGPSADRRSSNPRPSEKGSRERRVMRSGVRRARHLDGVQRLAARVLPADGHLNGVRRLAARVLCADATSRA
jgi:hypothetical protein